MTKQITSLFTCAMLTLAPCASAATDDSGQLTGTPIGSPAMDHASGMVSETVNTPADAFDGGTTFFTDTLKIRGRGNGSWEVSNTIPYGGVIWRKLPYRLKLAHKANLLGMPAKAKNWVLLNNLSDKTLIRNMVAFEASRRMGMDYTPAARMVDVMYNGELRYHLFEPHYE